MPIERDALPLPARRSVLRLASLLTAVLASLATAAANPVADCNDATEPSVRIEGCTVIIRAAPSQEVVATALMNRAIAYAQSGDLKAALKDLDFALDADPELIAAHYNRGNVKLDLGRPRDAIADFDAVIAEMPEFALAWLNRGLARERIGDAEGALGDYRKALELEGSLGAAKRAIARLESRDSVRQKPERREKQRPRRPPDPEALSD